jgi:hypothetical protein
MSDRTKRSLGPHFGLIAAVISAVISGCLFGDEDCDETRYCKGNNLWYCEKEIDEWGGIVTGIKSECERTARICIEEDEVQETGCYFPDLFCPEEKTSFCTGVLLVECDPRSGRAKEKTSCANEGLVCVEGDASAACEPECTVELPYCVDHVAKKEFMACIDGTWETRRCMPYHYCREIPRGQSTYAVCVPDVELCTEAESYCENSRNAYLRCDGYEMYYYCEDGCREIEDVDEVPHIYCAQSEE